MLLLLAICQTNRLDDEYGHKLNFNAAGLPPVLKVERDTS